MKKNPFKILLLMTLLSLLSLGFLFVRYIYTQYHQLPNIKHLLSQLEDESKQLPSEVFDSKGHKIGEFYEFRKYYIDIDKIPPHVKNAFLSAEDQSFYQHSGIDIVSILRAAFINLKHRKIVQGASTITQQLVKNNFLEKTKTFDRKVKEVILALAIERKYSKNQIFELYLNSIFLGENSYGIEAASQKYFGKSVVEISVGEAALLAGLPQAPSRLAPTKNYQLAKERQFFVLNQMYGNKYITQKEFETWVGKDLKIKNASHSLSENQYFINEVKKEVDRLFEVGDLRKKGLRIFTNLDLKLQEKLSKSIQENVVTDLNYMQAAGVVVDHRTGAVVAMQGGYSYKKSQFNRVVQTKRYLDQLMIPIIAATSLDQGFHVFDSVDVDRSFESIAKKKNYNFPSIFETIINQDQNNAITLSAAIGINEVLKTAQKIGINSKFNDLRLVMGMDTITPLKLAQAYGALVNQGHVVNASYINSIRTFNGELIFKRQSINSIKTFKKSSTTKIMKKILESNFAKNIQANMQEHGGYLVVTKDKRDQWLVAHHHHLTTVLWMGQEQKKNIKNNTMSAYDLIKIYQSIFLNFNSKMKSESLDLSYKELSYKDRNGQVVKTVVPFSIMAH